ncbi:hemicentin-2-like [Stylophora pistillata]|uniref:hemicentin-2-like n=1 Tax=Stylophora pistillata TaxID=50429 RepID=UPI000C04CAFE|nr:hemicentin-2-like [Stylophora pistillata]
MQRNWETFVAQTGSTTCTRLTKKCKGEREKDATIIWTLPSPQRGPLAIGDTSTRTTVKELDVRSLELRLEWDFTLSDESRSLVSWRIGNTNIGNKYKSEVVTIFPAFQGQFDISARDPATLIIYNKTDADGAKFTCSVITNVRIWDDTISVVIYVSPQITSASDSENVTEGSELVLFCNATGKPVPNITWTRVLEDGTDSQKLFVGNPWIIVSISRTATGTYSCTADNGIRSPVNHTISVNVLFGVKDVTLERNTTENSGCNDLWVNFTCNASVANPPVHNYLLLKNETKVSFSKKGTWIEKISRGETFVYQCQAYQKIDNVTSSNNVTVAVNEPPALEQLQNVSVDEGGNLLVECDVTAGTPFPTVFWENFKSGQVVKGKMLNITNITRNQTEYRCIANNSCGGKWATMFIDVQYKPSATLSSHTIKLELGEDRSIGCPVDIGNPPAVIAWYKGNDTSGSKMTKSSIVEVKNASLLDEGWYTCFAKNELGNTTVNLLLVLVKPVSSTVATSSKTSPAGILASSQQDRHITRAKKSLLYHQNTPWIKKNTETMLDVTMGSYDGAETCELIGSYMVSLITASFKDQVGLYHDDGLVVCKATPREIEKIKQQVTNVLKSNGLKITIEANKNTIHFLDVTFDLKNGTYKPFLKPNNKVLPIHRQSNQPPTLLKNIPENFNKRLASISCNEKVF